MIIGDFKGGQGHRPLLKMSCENLTEGRVAIIGFQC